MFQRGQEGVPRISADGVQMFDDFGGALVLGQVLGLEPMVAVRGTGVVIFQADDHLENAAKEIVIEFALQPKDGPVRAVQQEHLLQVLDGDEVSAGQLEGQGRPSTRPVFLILRQQMINVLRVGLQDVEERFLLLRPLPVGVECQVGVFEEDRGAIDGHFKLVPHPEKDDGHGAQGLLKVLGQEIIGHLIGFAGVLAQLLLQLGDVILQTLHGLGIGRSAAEAEERQRNLQDMEVVARAVTCHNP